MNSRTSGPPACANLIVRDMVPPLSRVADVKFDAGANGGVHRASHEGLSRATPGKVNDYSAPVSRHTNPLLVFSRIGRIA